MSDERTRSEMLIGAGEPSPGNGDALQQLEATAYLENNVVKVSISGQLADSCHSARITDKYPGGLIMYVMDPGRAQVFIEVSKIGEPCRETYVSWEAKVEIPHERLHKLLAVYVNRRQALEVSVK